MTDPFGLLADRLQNDLLVPLLYQLGWMQWQELAFGWALFAVYGALQVLITVAICMPLERWRPVARWPDARPVLTDMFYTLLARVGLLPLVTFVAFYHVKTWFSSWLLDLGWLPPNLETIFPGLIGRPLLTFLAYAVILDFADYWRHRMSHRLSWWYALHALHHAQKQMTFWSDDRNHLLDDLGSAMWFGIVALLIGISPFQFPLLVLVLRFLESLSHANTRISFGALGERLLISPRFHRAHHGIRAAGSGSCNYGAVLPWWDMVFGTAHFSTDYLPTGDPSADQDLVTGGYISQQRAGLRRMIG